MKRISISLASLLFAASAIVLAQAPDRSKPPASGPAPALKLPAIQKRQLSNGMPVWLVELHEVPVAQVNLLVSGGSADDPASKFGVASLMAAMLAEGAGTRNSLDIADAIDFLGADLSASAAVNSMGVRLHVPVARLADALPIMADVAMRPTFPASELERIRQQRLTSLLQARDDPSTTAALAFSKVLYGGDHRFGTATMGTAETIKAFTVQDLQSFYNATIRPETSTLVVAGDITMDKALPLLESNFGKWKAAAPAPSRPPLSNPGQPVTRVVYLVDKPNAPQSQIRIGWIGVPRSTPDYFPLLVMNTILGGSFSSRLNLNLREKHGYTYGASSNFDMRLTAGPFTSGAGVQTDKTSESLMEFFNELNGILKTGAGRRTDPRQELRGASVPLQLRINGRHFAPPGGHDPLQAARRVLLAIRSEHSGSNGSRRLAGRAEVRRSRQVRRRRRGRQEGHRARDPRAQPRRDQGTDDRQRFRPVRTTHAERTRRTTKGGRPKPPALPAFLILTSYFLISAFPTSPAESPARSPACSRL